VLAPPVLVTIQSISTVSSDDAVGGEVMLETIRFGNGDWLMTRSVSAIETLLPSPVLSKIALPLSVATTTRNVPS
jgi:hypothetical protein